jgi:hypothetical protein
MIVAKPTIDLVGAGVNGAGPVRIFQNGEFLTEVGAAAGGFNVANVALLPGPNLFETYSGGLTSRALVFRVDSLAPRQPQKVRFVWQSETDNQLKLLARGTLTFAPSETALTSFIGTVRGRVPQIFKEYYRGIANIEVAAADGPDVTTIVISPKVMDVFGEAVPDCGNLSLKSEVLIYVGTFRSNMVRYPELWRPMAKSDDWQVRAEDIAQAIGRTAAHEMGHAMGLTAPSHEQACAWMEGDTGYHNDETVNLNPSYRQLAKRFAHGWHVMDPGEKTLNHIRLGEASASERGVQRTRAHFESFSASYLSAIHPLP